MNGDVQSGAVTITGNIAGMAFSSYDLASGAASSSSLTINGDFSVILDGAGGWGSKALRSGAYNPLSVEIRGDALFDRLNNTGTLTFTLGGNSADNALKSLKIDGDFRNNTGQIGFGSFVCERDASKIAGDKYYYYKNADVRIGGAITGTATVFLSSAGINNTIISVNGSAPRTETYAPRTTTRVPSERLRQSFSQTRAGRSSRAALRIYTPIRAEKSALNNQTLWWM